MIVGTTILRLDGSPFYSPEFGRGGLSATFSADVTHISLVGATQFNIAVQTRNAEDTTWSTLGNFSAISGAGAVSKDLTGLKELVRFAFTFSGGTPAAADAVHLLIQAPAWRPY